LSDPFVLMIAGPNGAGKTTLTQNLQQQDVDLGEYINPDEIAAGLVGSLEQRTIEAQQISDPGLNCTPPPISSDEVVQTSDAAATSQRWYDTRRRLK
jgi:septin family protein